VKCVAVVEVPRLTPRYYDRSCKNLTFLGVCSFPAVHLIENTRRYYEIYAVVRINVVGELLDAIRIHVHTLSVLGFLDEVTNALCGDHFNPSVPPSDS
jgi:hypothetical protein